MENLKGFYPLFFVLIAGLLILSLHRPILRWFAANRDAYNGAKIGIVLHAEGSVRKLHKGDVEIMQSPTPEPAEIRDGDALQASVESKADFILDSGDSFELPASSGIKLHLGKPGIHQSPIYVEVLFGTLNSQGTPQPLGGSYVIWRGALYFPKDKPTTSVKGISIPRGVRLSPNILSSARWPDDNSTAFRPDTLSPQYVHSRLEIFRPSMQECWLLSLRKKPRTNGTAMTIRFEITSIGAVAGLEVNEFSGEDDELKECVAKVAREVAFHPFKGHLESQEITVTFE